MTRRRMVSASCCGFMSRLGRHLRACPGTSKSRASRLFATSSRRHARRIFRRAGSRQSRHTVRHVPAAMAGAQKGRPAQDVAIGDHHGVAACHLEPSPGAGSSDRPSVPPADVWTCAERHRNPGHSRSRTGEWCIGHRPGALFDAPATPEGDVTDSKASRMYGAPSTRRASPRHC
jgi:hypothetical protein